MMSCVENTFTGKTFTPLANYMQAVNNPGNPPYGAIVGFDYDWTQHLTDSGALLEAFLEQIAKLGPTSIDIMAHSEGVLVALYAASQTPDRAKIKNFISLAGPILGTPLAQSDAADMLIYVNYDKPKTTPSPLCPASSAFHSMVGLLQAPFVQDLQPNSNALTVDILPAVKNNLGNTTTKIFVAGGENSGLLGLLDFNAPFGSTPNDGIVGLNSALAFNAGFQVYPFPPFPSLFHTDLPSDPGVLNDIANQVIQSSSPQLTCLSASTNCTGAQDTPFIFAGTGFNSNVGNIQVRSQDSTGTVTLLQTPGLANSGGTISWPMPIGTQPIGLFSVFAFDSTLTLASNNVMQTICSGNCTSGTPPAAIAVSPLTAQVTIGGHQAFTATVTGLSNTAVTWSVNGSIGGDTTVGTISTTGSDTALYTAPATVPSPTTVTVTATSQADASVSGSASVTIEPAGTITISPASVVLAEGRTQQFAATVSGGGTVNVNWTVAGGSADGTITSAGLYTAPNTTGTFHVVATNAVDTSQTAAATVTVTSAPANPNEWTWMSGSSTIECNGTSTICSVPGTYGTLGTTAAGNIPGSRVGASSWTDTKGNLWLFGGFGSDANGVSGVLNDLWEFNPSTNEWAWMGGSSTVPTSDNGSGGQPGVYGTLGTPAAGNIPGGRSLASSWIDSSGNLWLFGGQGYDANGNMGYLNDLWEFNPSTKEWAWIGGSNTSIQPGVSGTLGTPAPGNIPGSRNDASSWADSSGNLWLFGGQGYDANGNMGYLNDLWEFNPSTKEWVWIGGTSVFPFLSDGQPGVYGTLDVPAAGNVPGGREAAASWTDGSGNLWLFGGWVNSLTTSGVFNDLWEFNPSTHEWAWMGGSSTVGSYGVYGTLDVPAAGNVPGSRQGATRWIDQSGNLWLFGGQGYDANGNMGDLNDLWRYQP